MMNIQNERNEQHYNLRAREVQYKVGQEVFRVTQPLQLINLIQSLILIASRKVALSI